MKRIILLFALLLSPAAFAQNANIASPSAPCVAFGSTTGTCLQGGGALGSPSTAGTMPAFTLGGTISGNTNAISNISALGLGAAAGAAGTLTMYSTAGYAPVMVFWDDSSGIDGSYFYMRKSVSGGHVSAGNYLGTVLFTGYNTSSTESQSWEMSAVVSAVSASTVTSDLNFYSVPLGTNVMTMKGATGAVTLFNTLTISGIASTAQADMVCTTSAGLLTYQAYATGCVVSSERFKDMKASLTPDEAKHLALNLTESKLWTYKNPEQFGDSSEYAGFTAEQIAAIDPRFITYDDEGKPYAIKHQQLAEVAMTGFSLILRDLEQQNDKLRACNDNWKCRIFGIR